METDVLIVGAGPAGAAASIFLSKAGVPHVIIDKAIFPRDKICGDACSGKTAYVLRTANESWLPEIFGDVAEVQPTTGITFGAPNGLLLDIPFAAKDAPPTGFTTPRLVFDNFLFKKLDARFATIYTGVETSSFTREEDGTMKAELTVGGAQKTILAKCIIGADGNKSHVRKTFFAGAQSPKAHAVGLRAYYSKVPVANPNFLELLFLPELLPGYLWIFPLPGGRANVGVGMLSEDVRRQKINLRERMLHCLSANPALRDRFKGAKPEGKIQGWGLPMGIAEQPVCGDGFLLTGDAAMLIDPFSGEGIGNALYSGMIASRAIVQARAAGDFSEINLQQLYEAPLYKRIGSELRTSYILQRLCRYPWLFNFVVRKAHKSPTLRGTISAMFTDLDLRKKLSQPRFYLKMLMNR